MSNLSRNFLQGARNCEPILKSLTHSEFRGHLGVLNNTIISHRNESTDDDVTGKQKTRNCSEMDTFLRKTGYVFANCSGNLGNQVCILGLGLQMYLQSGVKLVIKTSQSDKLNTVVDVQNICREDGSTFCIIWPKDCKMDTESMKYYDDRKTFRETLTSKLDFVGKAINMFTCPCPLDKLADDYHNVFKQQVQFRDSVWSEAKLVYDSLKKRAVCTAKDKNTECPMVFVHMRMANYYHKKMRARNDFNIYDKTDYVQVAFRNASITYQTSTIFVLGYTDKDVFNFFEMHSREFDGLDIIFVSHERSNLIKDPHKYAAIDMVLLSMADVLIMTVGTYGESGALLGKEKQAVYLPDYYGYTFSKNITNSRFIRIPFKQWQ
ncbi:uncharacterized protein LOC134847689 isoform X2 [Symsagittifera roscoffensis]|uniref:uncharacterized protein LOC134847689 isoform X2 n=1 Tax=Symsagittifera roscoffensis TaxID=84072 RepID=UPI00307CC713